MLRDSKNDLFHLLNILESIGKVQKYTSEIDTAEEFIERNDQMVYNATLTLLANIGETLGKVSDFSLVHLSKVDLKAIRGMRNRIAHDYSGLDSFIIFDIVNQSLLSVKVVVWSLVNLGLSEGIFDKEEFELAMTSSFYKHIDFSKKY